MNIRRRAAVVALSLLPAGALVVVPTPALAAQVAPSAPASAAIGAAAARVTCRTVYRQFQVRLSYPNPYPMPGVSPYFGGILTVLVPQVSGARQQGVVAVRYVMTGQGFSRTASNARGGYVSVRYGATQSMTAQLIARTSKGSSVSCGTFRIPPVRSAASLPAVAEGRYANY